MKYSTVLAAFAGVASAAYYEPAPPAYTPKPYKPAGYKPEPYKPEPYTKPAPYKPEPYKPEPYKPAGYKPAPYKPEPYKPKSNETYVTSTVYATHMYTVTSCEAYVTNCPAHSTVVKTVTVPAYTTICPVTETQKPIPIRTYAPGQKPTVPVYYNPTSSAAAVPATTPCPTATNVPYVPGKQPIYSTSAAAVPNPPVGTATGTVGTVSPSGTGAYYPHYTGAASKAGAGSLALIAGAAAAMLL